MLSTRGSCHRGHPIYARIAYAFGGKGNYKHVPKAASTYLQVADPEHAADVLPAVELLNPFNEQVANNLRHE
jgi:hypothetical protein